MPADNLRDLLQASLGEAYALERELGGGGMSRVFVARDVTLGRSVVIKVMTPELAGELSGDRFAREVKVAAQLQDPHIVPVLAAGNAGGLPYYTMPYVAGDSLRDRLRRDPKLPVPEAIEVLRGMLLALAAAHDAGVVHRDIKPENVLLTRAGTPMVTDFGIAKAVAAAKTAAEASATDPTANALTALGTSLGTPAYMAPEQAAGGDVDHRADLYAWGVIAYELLSGAHPFAGKVNAQQLIAAHLMETPAPLAPKVSGAPADLIRLVERALAKSPADRPSSAREILRGLDETTGRGHARPSVSDGARVGRRVVLGGVIVVLLTLAGLMSMRGRGVASPTLSPARVVVLPFDNQTGDSTLAPLGAMAADWITRGLSETGLVDVAVVPASASRDSARLAAARNAGAGTLLSGTIYRAGDSVRIVATVTDVNAGKVATSLEPVTAAAADPLAGLETLRRRVAGALAQRVDPGFDPERLAGTPPSFEAYRAILEARDATGAFARGSNSGGADIQRERLQRSGELLRRAQMIDTAYALPVLEEVQVRLSQRNFARTDTLLAWLNARLARLTPFEKARLDLHLVARRGGFTTGRLEASRRFVALAPRSAAAQAALARAALSVNRVRMAESVYAQIDTSRLGATPSFWVDRAQVARRLGDHQRELSGIDALVRRLPDDPNLVGWKVRALAALGRTDDVQAIVDSMARRAHITGEDEVFGAAIAGLLAAGRDSAAKAVANILVRRRQNGAGPRFDLGPSYATVTIAALEFAGQHSRAVAVADSVIATLAQLPAHRLITGVENDYPIWLVSLRGAVLAHGGDSARANAADRQLQLLRPRAIALPAALVGRAAIAAQLGRRDDAVARLREAIDAGATFAFTASGSVLYLNSGIAPDSPWFTPLKGYQPFEDLMRPIR